ncbi:hypothetical protein ACHWQZ_G003651 [Mnemiopsis leidyi]
MAVLEMEPLIGDLTEIGAPIRWLDITIAVILILSSIIGVAGNMVSLIFFTTEQVRNQNRRFFKCIYQTINIVDLLICLTLFPVIGAFLQDPGYPEFKENIPVMFGNHEFCTVWGLLWEILPSFSVYLVGVLSISRLVLLVCKNTKLVPSIVCVFMATYFFLTLSIKLSLLLTHDAMDYEPMMRYCFLVSHNDENFTKNEITTLALMITQLALPIIPVSISFLITMAILMQDGRKKKTSRKQNHQRRAAITVVLVTLLYIIFNIPVLINFLFYLNKLITNTEQGQKGHFTDIYSTPFLFYYAWPLVYVVSVAINSAVNPCIYFWRMKKYRTFIVGVVGDSYHLHMPRLSNLRAQLSGEIVSLRGEANRLGSPVEIFKVNETESRL